MQRDEQLFIVLEHINKFKNNRYKDLRDRQIYGKSNDKNQLCLLEKAEKKNAKAREKAELKVIN